MSAAPETSSFSVRAALIGDIATAAFLAVGAAYCAWAATGLLGHISILVDPRADDVWFEADVGRVFDNMTLRLSNHYRTQVHPLFSLFGLGITHLFSWMHGVDKLAAVRLSIASMAALWMALFFILLRTLQCRRLDAAVFAVVAATSGSALFWTAVPETYLFGSATIVAVLVITALSERRHIAPWVDVCMAAGSLSMLLTNWMFGLISLTVRHKMRVAAQLAANSLVLVVFLWAVQKFLSPSAHFFLGDHEPLSHGGTNSWTLPRIFFIDTLVMPDIQSIPNDYPWLWPKLSVQNSATWRLTASGTVALLAWTVLFAAGVWAMLKMKSLKRFRLVLAIGIAGQLLLHAIYGNESFLYALNWLPLLVTVAALATLTRLRWLSLTAAIAFIASAAPHNYAELKFAFDSMSASTTLTLPLPPPPKLRDCRQSSAEGKSAAVGAAQITYTGS